MKQSVAQSSNQLLTIQESADLLHVAAKTLRRWEEKGVLIPQRSEGGHRRYDKSQVLEFKKQVKRGKHLKIAAPVENVEKVEPVLAQKPAVPILQPEVILPQVKIPEISPIQPVIQPIQFQAQATVDGMPAAKNFNSIHQKMGEIEQPNLVKNFVYKPESVPNSAENLSTQTTERWRSAQGLPTVKADRRTLSQTPQIPQLYHQLHQDQKQVLRRGALSVALVIALFLLLKLSPMAGQGLALAATKVPAVKSMAELMTPVTNQLDAAWPFKNKQVSADLAERVTLRQSVLGDTQVNDNLILRINVPSEFSEQSTFDKDITVGGAIAANGGSVTSTASTFNLVNTTSKTVNIAGAASQITIGSTAGITEIRDALNVADITKIKGVSYSFPIAQGASSTFLKNDGTGQLTWETINVPTQLSDLSGTLGVGQGGTGSTSFAGGSVIFSDGSKLTENNANFFFDNTNDRLGILTNSPQAALSVGSSSQFQVDSGGAIAAVTGYTQPSGNFLLSGADTTVTVKSLAASGGVLYTDVNGKFLNSGPGLSGQCLTTDGVGSLEWVTCIAGPGSAWQFNNGFLSPENETVDVGIGGSSTASAKFAFLNVSSGTPTASISGSTAGNALSLNGDGTITTSLNRSLVLNPAGGNVGVGVSNPLAPLNVGSALGEQFRVSYDPTHYVSETVDSTGKVTFSPTGGQVRYQTAGANTGAYFYEDSNNGANYLSFVQDHFTGQIYSTKALAFEPNDQSNVYQGLSYDGSNLNLNLNNTTGTASITGPTGGDLTIDTSGANKNLVLTTGTGNVIVSSFTTNNGVLYANGAGVLAQTAQGAAHTVLHGNGSGVPTFSAIDLTADVANLLPITNGGTNSNATPTAGAVAYGTGSAYAFMGANAVSGLCLTSGGAGAPSWSSCAGSAGEQFESLNGAIVPLNSTEDFFVGGQASSSAKFAFLNVNSGTPTASISGSTAGNALSLNGDGTITTSNNRTLALNPTGGNVGIGTSTATSLLTLKGTGTEASLGAEKVTNGSFGTGDLTGWTATTWTYSAGTAAYTGTTGPIATVANGGIKLNYGGTGYSVNDVLTLTNGANDATVTVTAVSSGTITAFNLTTAGTANTVAATVAVTGGTGTGAQFQIDRLADSTNTLSQNVSVTANNIYQVTYTVTRSVGELKVTLGGTVGNYVNAAATYTQNFTATNTGNLIFTPTDDFTGSVTGISVKQVTTTNAPFALLNSAGGAGFEIRSGGTGLFNTLEGYQAGQSITTGANNTANGYQALLLNTTGSRNTATGYLALSANTTAPDNTANGYKALAANTTGTLNSAFGSSALAANTIGIDNTAVGYQSLLNNTTGSINTAVGYFALGANTIGANNTALGWQALPANTTGGTNTAVGVESLFKNTTGGTNTALGYLSLESMTTGSNNIAVGGLALAGNVTGSNNIAIGGFSLFNDITGSGNVGLGVGSGQYETGSNKLYIANTSTPNPLIYGDFTAALAAINGSLGVRDMNPQAALDVVGTDLLSTSFGFKVKNTSLELITATNDRDFSSANDWTGTNWAITAGAYLHSTGSTVNATLTNANLTASSIINGTMYKVVFTVAGATAGSVTPKLGTAAGTAANGNVTYTEYIKAAANNADLIFTPTTDFNGSIDNISVTALADQFTIADNGAVSITNLGTQGGVPYITSTTGTLGVSAVGTSGQCLVSGGTATPTWSNCGVGSNQTFESLNGAIVPFNSTEDFLIGGQASSSAKFAFLNVNSGTPTASISGSVAGNALSLNGDGTITTSNNRTLALNPTGGNVGIGTTTASSLLTLKGTSTEASLGAEKVTNGSFGTGDLTGWTATTWTYNAGTAAYTGTTGPIAVVSNGGIKLNYGGTGYSVNDVLTLTNGANDATVTVAAVSATGTITSFTLTNAGTANTVNGVGVTGGTGTGALFGILRLADSTNTLSQNASITAGQTYQVTYVVTRSAGELKVGIGGDVGNYVNTPGTYTQTFTAANTGNLIFTPTDDFTGSITGISVKQITSTNAPFALLNSAGGNGVEIRSGGTGLNNTLVGFQSGESLSTGIDSSSLGYQALFYDTTGSRNVAIGYQSLFSNTTASDNVAIGNLALNANTIAVSNIAIGSSALKLNTIGSDNVAVGQSTLLNNTTGNSNTALGYLALTANTTASFNTALGLEALQSTTTGGRNDATGFQALSANTTGTNNNAYGFFALTKNVTGSTNTAFGDSALSSDITGTGNVALGYNAGLNEMGSGKLYIANSPTTLPLIYGDFSNGFASINGNLGVRDDNPQAALDVVGADALSTGFGLKVKNTSLELITATNDRDFSSANDWTGTNWAISGGAYLHTIGSTAVATLTNANMTASSIVSGTMYKISFSVAGATAGTVTPKLGTGAGTAVGQITNYTQYVKASGNNVDLTFLPTTDFNGSIDNISVTALTDNFTVADNGAVSITNLGTQGGVPYITSTTGTLGVSAVGTSGQCLVSGGTATPTWSTCEAGTNETFESLSGAIVPFNSTEDFLIGGQASNSAKFAVLNINSGTPTASVSAGAAGGLFFTASGSAQTTARQTLSLGGGTTGNIQFDNINNTPFATFDTTNNRFGLGTVTPAAKLDVQDIAITSGNGIAGTFNGLTSGFGLAMSSNSTALTTGGLASFDWSPGSATTATGDLVSLNVGAFGTIGNIFNIKNAGSSIFSVSQNQITANVPAAFNAPGDVSFAYDLQFTNPTASFIKSAAPLTIQSGEVFNSDDLTLRSFNSGRVVLDSPGGTVITNLVTQGAIPFTLDTNGTLGETAAGTSGQCLTSAGTGTPTWSNCDAAGNQLFTQVNGAITPLNSTEDFLIGGQASNSAKFAVLNVNSGTPTASVSAGTAGGLFFTASGSAQTTARQTLSLGGGTTGNIQINNINNTPFATFDTTNNRLGLGTAAPAAKLDIQDASITTTNGISGAFNGLTSGIGLAMSSNSTTLTTGGLASFDWSPGSATTATGDLVSLNVGPNGTIGNIFNVKSAGSSVFAISQNQITANLPTNFTAPGDLGAAYDLQFTNPVSSYVKSTAPLYIQAGEAFNSSDLTLRTFNSGKVVVDAAGGVTLAQAQPWSLATSTNALNIASGLVNLDTTNNRVGIGTTAPAFKLDVQDSQSATYSAMITNNDTGATSAGLGIKLGFTGTGSTTNYFETFFNGLGQISGAIKSTAANGVTYNTTGIDLAEYFVKDDVNATFPIGTLMCQGDNGVRACTPNDSASIVGIASENPAFLGGTAGSNKIIVALTGQVPLRVNTANGPIKSGDVISFSNQPGVGAKLDRAGAFVGTALADYTNSDPTQEGTIMVYVHPSYTDPDSSLVKNDLNNYTLNQLVDGSFAVNTPAGQVLDKVLTASDAVIGNLTAGKITAQTIQTNNLNANNVNIGSLTLDQYIAQVVQNLHLAQGSSASGSAETASGSANVSENASGNASGSADLADQAEDLLASGSGQIASGAAQIRISQADLHASANDTVIDATATYLSQYFETAGNAFVGNNLGVNNNLVLGKGLVVNDTGIDYLNTIAPADRQLSLLGSGKGSLNILAGVMTLNDAGQVIIKGDLTIHGRITTDDPDVAGYAQIKAGDSQVKITFTRPYATVPVITATPDDSDTHFEIMNKTVSGFVIQLKAPLATDANFNWTAISIIGAKTFESPSATLSGALASDSGQVVSP